ncbi:uncharacterized protein BDV17DRAFT_295826 [Aspergillus undulatus]|uniref:uncharacterized protein n=1 Tax=Aspergillus undulatus TaxID=1810928 RepID=UPI003CCDECF7
MFLPAVALAFLPLVYAIAFPSSAPTPNAIISYPSTQSPKPTPGPSLRHRPRPLNRREGDYSTIKYAWAVPEACGFENGLVDDGYYQCAESSTCMSHQQDLSYPGMIGCCSSTNCDFITSCVDASRISQSPSFTDTPQPFTSYCTQSSWPACATYIYSDISITNFACEESAGIWELYTHGLSTRSSGSVVERNDIYLTPANADMISSYVDAFSTASATPESTPSSDADSSSEKSSSTGAIAGGVVGGVAGVAAIAAAGFFLLKKRNTKQPDGNPALDDRGGEYKVVPELVQSGAMQMPPEMESSDPVHNLAEIQGTAGAYEMDSTQNSAEAGKKSFFAEMPGDTHFKR